MRTIVYVQLPSIDKEGYESYLFVPNPIGGSVDVALFPRPKMGQKLAILLQVPERFEIFKLVKGVDHERSL